MENNLQENLPSQESFQFQTEKKLFGIKELLKMTFILIKERLRTLLAVWGVGIVVMFFLVFISGLLFANALKISGILPPKNLSPHFASSSSAVIFVLLIVIFVTFIFLYHSLILATLISALGERKGFKEAIKTGWQKMLPLFWVSILSGLAIFGGFLLFIVPAIIFAVWFAFVDYSVVLDKKRGFSALRFSKQLVSVYWWKVFARLVVGSLLAWLISFVLALVPIVGNLFAQIFSFTFATSFGLLLYLDLKKVKGM